MTLPDVLATAPGLRAADILFDGLAVLCFNKINSERFWEAAFPRQARHTLTLKIEALDADDQPIEEVFNDEVPRDVVSFDIRLTNGSLAHYTLPQFQSGGPSDPDFDRSGADNDPHDLGWMIDLDGPELRHGRLVKLMPFHRSRPISLARISHSLFCTLKPEDDDVKISPRESDDPNAAESFVLGRTNMEIVGVLLGNAPGMIQFRSEPAGLLNIDLPYDENRRYHIEMINEDIDDATHMSSFVRGDLRLLYDTVIQVDGEPKDLWARPAVAPARFAPDGDCHTDKYNGATLQGLIQQ